MHGSYASYYARQASKAGHAERVRALAGRIAPLLPFTHGLATVTEVTFDSSRIALLSGKAQIASYAPDTIGWYDLMRTVSRVELERQAESGNSDI